MTTTYPSKYDHLCLDCKLPFEEAEARNASLDPTEFNVACPSCGGDNIKGKEDGNNITD